VLETEKDAAMCILLLTMIMRAVVMFPFVMMIASASRIILQAAI
jgi:hypothetical protein